MSGVLALCACGMLDINDQRAKLAALEIRPSPDPVALTQKQVTAVGELASLDDFPLQGRPGIYFLEPYDTGKMPVLFVHGINGSPRNFRTLIARLDRKQFQPWAAYYASGVSLGEIAEQQAQIMRSLEVQYDFPQFAVVGHSMGGLVARGLILRYRQGGGAQIPLFVSIATPWDGSKAAAAGVKTALRVVPVWIDMAPGSEYLKSIYATELGVPHCLLFTFKQKRVAFGEANDGTVTLASQLRRAAQQGAVRIQGFNETHMGVLESAEVSELLNDLLAHATGAKTSGRGRGGAGTPRVQPETC